MALHRRTHPTDVEGCQGCKFIRVQFGTTSSPQSATEKRWEKDMPAFKSLVEQGYNPAHIDGSADMVARAATRFEIESGQIHEDKKQLTDAIKIVEDTTGHSVFEAQATPIKAAG